MLWGPLMFAASSEEGWSKRLGAAASIRPDRLAGALDDARGRCIELGHHVLHPGTGQRLDVDAELLGIGENTGSATVLSNDARSTSSWAGGVSGGAM